MRILKVIDHIAAICGNPSKSYIRSVLRSFKTLNDSNQLKRLRTITEVISNTQLQNGGLVPNKLLRDRTKSDYEEMVRLYIISIFSIKKFKSALLFSLEKNTGLVYPLPKNWQRGIEKNSLKVNRLYCDLSWHFFIVNRLIINIAKSIRIIHKILIKETKISSYPNFAYFQNTKEGSMIVDRNNLGIRNLLYWYLNWKGRDISIDHILHDYPSNDKVDNIKIVHSELPFLIPNSKKLITKISLWLFLNTIKSIFKLMQGKWDSCLMLEEFFLAYLVQNIDKKLLARDYFFTFRGMLYRPIWTFKAEQKGSKFLFYFYSISLEPTKIGTDYDNNNSFFNWHLNKWSTILAWNKHHKNYLKTKTDDRTKILKSGPISMSDSNDKLVIPDNSIAVFDFEKYKISKHFGIGSLQEYQSDKNDLPALFLLGIQILTAKYGYWMVIKRKRNRPKLSSKRQLKLYKKLSQFPNVLFVNPLISAERVIDNSKAVISMPFTSTAHYGKDNGKQSVYYDPCNWIRADDQAAQGIKICSSSDRLEEWIKNLPND